MHNSHPNCAARGFNWTHIAQHITTFSLDMKRNVPNQIHPDSPNGRATHINPLICTESASGGNALPTQGVVAHPTSYISYELSGGRPL